MDKKCSQARKTLISLNYDFEESISRTDISAHLKGCKECRIFLSTLEKIKTIKKEEPGKINHRIINDAFAAVNKNRYIRQKGFETAVFITGALIFLAFVLTLIYFGQGSNIIILQILITAALPFIFLYLLRKRLKENHHNE